MVSNAFGPLNGLGSSGVTFRAVSFLVRSRAGHHAEHEISKERNGKCGISMGRTVNHALLDDAIAQWRDCLYFVPKGFGYISGALWPCPEVSHGTQILLFAWCQPVEPDPDKALVE